MKIVSFILNLIGWFQITIGMTLLAALIGFVIYYATDYNDKAGTAAIVITSFGFLSGTIWATKIWIKHGTVAWLSRIRRTS